MAPQQYTGPTTLAYSRYASPQLKKAQPTVPSAVSSIHNTPTKNTIATKEQIVASRDESALDISMSRNSDAELAIASGNALKEEVDKHAAKFSRTVSAAVANTKKILELIREALNKEDESALKTVDALWTELELLFEAAKGAKEALPDFLEKQRNNMALYHGSIMNETYRETQQELNMQHKKVNLQHGLILEHQQAFQDYKASTAAKLKELEDLRERVSRLTLEKGNFKDEIDKYAQLLDTEQANKAGELKKAEAHQEELKALRVSKKELLAEVEGLQKTISDLQEKMQAAEQQVTDRFTAELKAKTDQLAKETTKTTSLTTLLSTLKAHESNAKIEIEKLKTESKLVNEKYNRMAAEHAQAFSDKDRNQTIDALTSDRDRLRKESANMQARLTKLPELEKANASLFKDKSSLLDQVGKLTIELSQAKENSVKLNKELATLTEALQEVRSQKASLETENQDLLSKQKKLDDSVKKVTQAVTIFKGENAKLKEVVDKLQANQAVGGSRLTSGTDQSKAALEKIKELEDQKEDLKKALDEWTALAKRSYKEYKEMLPTYKQAEHFQKAALEKEEQIKSLKLQLSSASSKPNGVAGGDAAYWKAKYDHLMATVSN
ncbi:hypothetical protein CC86DRAFT_331032 [Ophiobolus disseminans]|uniref:Uncharacterized protein n=1 Tax=Ophiobolus disseminans TaxID=1469910 RepID=A0A6A6ZM53_9PLEO|nr:hypothetical protein CC86DRAFT_331032 [Ophiobolus disseminans]